jgi:hypothetical protein
MKKRITLSTVIIYAIAFCAQSEDPNSRCSVNRWLVKTGVDSDILRVNLRNRVPVTIKDLQRFHRGRPFTYGQLRSFNRRPSA